MAESPEGHVDFFPLEPGPGGQRVRHDDGVWPPRIGPEAPRAMVEIADTVIRAIRMRKDRRPPFPTRGATWMRTDGVTGWFTSRERRRPFGPCRRAAPLRRGACARTVPQPMDLGAGHAVACLKTETFDEQ